MACLGEVLQDLRPSRDSHRRSPGPNFVVAAKNFFVPSHVLAERMVRVLHDWCATEKKMVFLKRDHGRRQVDGRLHM
jgi:hypothetical protein